MSSGGIPFTFIPVPDFALARGVPLGPAMLLGAILARYDFDTDEAKIGQRSLARRIGSRDRTTVRRWLAELQSAGLVQILGKTPRGYTRVRVIPPGSWRPRSVDAEGGGTETPRGHGAPGVISRGWETPQKKKNTRTRTRGAAASAVPHVPRATPEASRAPFSPADDDDFDRIPDEPLPATEPLASAPLSDVAPVPPKALVTNDSAPDPRPCPKCKQRTLRRHPSKPCDVCAACNARIDRPARASMLAAGAR